MVLCELFLHRFVLYANHFVITRISIICISIDLSQVIEVIKAIMMIRDSSLLFHTYTV